MQNGNAAGAVIAAAGMSARMGSFKPLLQLGKMSFVQRIIASFRQADVFPIVLVTGFRARELEKHVAGEGVICVHNPDFETTEMIDSARFGFRYLADKCSRIFFSPVDTPLFRVSTVQALLGADGQIVRPSWQGQGGHPVLFHQDVLPRLLEGGGEEGLAGILRCLADKTRWVSVEDEGITKDADTPADYAELLELHNRQLLRPEITVRLAREGTVLDPETAMLLRVIRYDGTVKEACSRLQISYRKAWTLIGRTEKNCGRALVERSAGGEYGGGSRLTPAGEQLLDAYGRFADHLATVARDCFRDYFPVEDE